MWKEIRKGKLRLERWWEQVDKGYNITKTVQVSYVPPRYTTIKTATGTKTVEVKKTVTQTIWVPVMVWVKRSRYLRGQ